MQCLSHNTVTPDASVMTLCYRDGLDFLKSIHFPPPNIWRVWKDGL
jgi:hypothetical protein